MDDKRCMMMMMIMMMTMMMMVVVVVMVILVMMVMVMVMITMKNDGLESWMKNVNCEWWMTCEDDDRGLMTDVDKYHTSTCIHSLIHMFSRKIKRNL